MDYLHKADKKNTKTMQERQVSGKKGGTFDVRQLPSLSVSHSHVHKDY